MKRDRCSCPWPPASRLTAKDCADLALFEMQSLRQSALLFLLDASEASKSEPIVGGGFKGAL